MKNTNTNEFKETVFAYICDSVYDFEGDQSTTAQHIRDRFESEFNYSQNRTRYPNMQRRIANWLAGLPLNIAYTYHDITEIAEKWHNCTLTEKQRETVQENWFNFLAMKTLQLWRKHNVKLPS